MHHRFGTSERVLSRLLHHIDESVFREEGIIFYSLNTVFLLAFRCLVPYIVIHLQDLLDPKKLWGGSQQVYYCSSIKYRCSSQGNKKDRKYPNVEIIGNQKLLLEAFSGF